MLAPFQARFVKATAWEALEEDAEEPFPGDHSLAPPH